jgi:hypothetical protein
LAVKATPKAIKIIEKEWDERCEEHTPLRIIGVSKEPEPLSKREIVSLTWKCYIPATVVGTCTIACILGANILNQRQQASIASLYAMLDQSYQQYRKAACEVYGEDADDRIRVQVAQDVYASSDGNWIYDPSMESDSDKVLFYDEYSKQYFESTLAAVLNAQYHINRNWSLKGEVAINEFYEFLGIEPIKGGDEIGWTYEFAEEGYMWIDFRLTKMKVEDGLECLYMSYPEPELMYVAE